MPRWWIPPSRLQRDRVFFGATVTYANERDEEVTVTIVGVDEADMAAGKISIGSPVALALLRAQRGDEVTVRTPRGPEVLEVVAIRVSASSEVECPCLQGFCQRPGSDRASAIV